MNKIVARNGRFGPRSKSLIPHRLFDGLPSVGIITKTAGFTVLLCCTLQTCLRAQTLPPPLPISLDAAAAAKVPATIVARSANQRVWAKVSTVTNDQGAISTITSPAYTELGSGLCKFSTESNRWIDADPSIDIVGNGAAATGTQHSVTFAGDAAAAGGAVTLTTPDGKVFTSSVYGLAYYDTVTGNNVLLGSLQSSQGFVVGNNEVVFSNCFSGSVSADLEYFNRLSGLEQNVVLRSSLPSPDSFQGLNNGSTMLEVWSEFLSAPAPQASTVTTGGQADALLLDFGAMKMVEGSAFATPPGQSNAVALRGSHVLKSWVQQSGRTFLVEQIPYSAASNQVQNLVPHASIEKPGNQIKHVASLLPIQPRRKVAERPSRPMKVAKAELGGPGYAIDYSLVTGSPSNFVFQGDVTYCVSNTVYMYGSNIFEPGTVVKFSGRNTNNLELPDPAGGFGFNGTSYKPTVFTDCNDNTVGAVINGSTGAPATSNAYYLYWTSTNSAVTVSHARFSYANVALTDQVNTNSVTLRHCQFVNCTEGLFLADGFTVPATNQVYLQNVLLSGVADVVVGSLFTVCGENITADSCPVFAYTYGAGYSGSITNSIFTAVASGTNFSSFDHSRWATSGSGIYQVVGSASYYLPTNSTYHGAGTANIDLPTLADLRTMTTYSPLVVGQIISNSAVTYSNATPRDTGTPDIGFHYDPIDVAIVADVIYSTITVLPGTVVATYGGQGAYGICLNTGSTMNCQGTATSPNYIVNYNTVQEQSNPSWPYLPTGSDGAPAVFFYDAENPDPSSLYCRFTIWSQLAGGTHFYAGSGALTGQVGLTDCQFYGGLIDCLGETILSTNSLYWRVGFSLREGGADSHTFCNNLFWQGGLFYNHNNSGIWTFRDNLFDQVIFTNKASVNIDVCSNNAYVTNAATMTLAPLTPDHNDVFLSNSPAYQTGTLGQFYYPSTQTDLIHEGSRLASAAGLYHYTVTTNNAIDGTNIVSIGFHYVATDGNGVPLDTGDGVPDYIKDSNGDGVFDSGDFSNWQDPFNIYDQGKSYAGYTPANVRLSYWRFNKSAETDEHGNSAFLNSGTTPTADWSSNSVYLTSSSELEYYTVQPGGTWTNIDAANGTVRFWFKPHWSSGPGPGGNNASATFLDIANSGGWWELRAASNGEVIQFQCMSNGIDAESSGGPVIPAPGEWDCAFVSGQWYQIALAYSPSNIAAYINGALIGTGVWPPQDGSGGPVYQTGYGMFVWPVIGASTVFSVGTDISFQNPMNGEMDELETFNYPLSAQAIAYGFATFNGANFGALINNTQDSDYVGRNDILRTLVDGETVPNHGATVVPCRLGYWRFNSPLWIGEQGQFPTSATNVTMGTGWSGGALNIGSAANSALTYPDVYTNGWANINCHQGTVRFWFKPNWNSGSAPTAPFISLGNGATNNWALELTGSTPGIVFTSTSNSAGGSLLGPKSLPFLSSNQWCQIVLTYGSTGCAIYTNGMLAVTNSTAETDWPDAANRATGMIIGNNSAYNSPINGMFDELETFNYQLNTNQIWTNFQAVWSIDNNLDGIPDIIQDTVLHNNTPFLGQPVAVAATIEAEQFDRGGSGVAYLNVSSNPASSYRATGMFITNCNDLGLGYCLDQTRSNEWVKYTINVLAPQTYEIETRVQGLGTNGAFQLSVSNSSGTTYLTSLPLVIRSTSWVNVTNFMNLQAGINTLTLTFVTNGQTGGTFGSYVGRFNYLTIYPWWQAGFTSTYTNSISLSVLSNNINTWTAATNNAIQIQNALNDVTNHGNGTVLIPPGTYYMAQSSPNETNQPFQNAAVSIRGTNIAISGAGMTTTKLVAYNRATSIFYLGVDPQVHTTQCTNITFLNMTLAGQQHLAVSTNDPTSTVYESGEFIPVNGHVNSVGMLLGISGVPNFSQYAYNILVSNCEFLNADRPIDISTYASNVLIRQCAFLWESNLYNPYIWDPIIPNSGPDTNIIVGVFGRSPIYNIGALENTYLGATNTGTNYILNQVEGGNGFLYYQGGGNSFALRNFITNNAEEAVQFDSGPVAVAGNTFWTLAVNSAACALAPNFNPSLSGALSSDYSSDSLTFVGNSIVGNAYGACNDGELVGPYSLNFSGNSLGIFLPANLTTNTQYIGSGVLVYGCQNLSACGNTMTSGGTGVTYYSSCSNSVILANNFSPVTLRSILDWGTALESSQVIGNILGQGVGYHLKAYYWEGPNWFLYNNQYLNAQSNAASAFTDAAGLYAHISH